MEETDNKGYHMRSFQFLKSTRPKGAKHTLSAAILLLLTTQSFGQGFFSYPPAGTVVKQSLTLRLTVGDRDSAFFALPDVNGNIADAADSVSVDPPSRVRNSGVASIEIQNIASVDTGGFAIDSTRIVVFGLNDSGAIIVTDSVTAGSITVANTLGNKSVHRITLTAGFDNVSGYFVRIIHGDLTHAVSFLVSLVASL